MPVTVYYNETCSKSRGVASLLQERGVSFAIRNYIAEPLSHEELSSLLQLLNVPAATLVRAGDALYRELYGEAVLPEAACIALLLERPELMERPIAVNGQKAVIARPPEKVLEII
jgi:arsenate reductase